MAIDKKSVALSGALMSSSWHQVGGVKGWSGFM